MTKRADIIVRPHSKQMFAKSGLRPIFQLAVVLKLSGFDGGGIKPPIYTLVFVDASDSIGWDIPGQPGTPRIQPIKEVLSTMITDLRPQDHLSIVKFTSTCNTKSAFMSDLLFGWKSGSDNKDEMRASLNNYTADGATAYAPALRAGADLIKEVPPGSLIQIDFLSDGETTEDDEDIARLCEELRKLGAEVFVTGFNVPENHAIKLKRMGKSNYMNAQTSADVVNFFQGAQALTMDAVIHNARLIFKPTIYCGPATIERVHVDNEGMYLAGSGNELVLGLLNADTFLECVAAFQVEMPDHLVRAAEGSPTGISEGAFGSFELRGDFGGKTDQLIAEADVEVEFATKVSGETDDHVEALLAGALVVKKLAQAGEQKDATTARNMVEEAAQTMAFTPAALQAVLAPKVRDMMKSQGDVRGDATATVTQAFRPGALKRVLAHKPKQQ